tara:strand:- start:13129 stop:15240 length:2112 start_codon:yes stop_codon:yes gene_type:complete
MIGIDVLSVSWQRGRGVAAALVFTDELTDGLGTPMAITTSLISTQAWQRGRSTLTLSGTYDLSGDPTGIAWRVGTAPWVQLTTETIGAGSWSGTLNIPSNYLAQGTLQVKPINGLNVTPAQHASVSVTDVVVVMGQSNANGFASNISPYDKTTFDMFSRVETGLWEVNTGFKSIFTAVAENLDQAGIPPVIFVARSQTGTGFRDNSWNPGDPIYNEAVANLNATLPAIGAPKAVVWVQGEADQGGTAAQGANWEVAMPAMRTAMNAAVAELTDATPWFIAITWRDNGAGQDTVRTAQRNVIANNSWAHEGLNVLGETFGDGIHYGTVGGSVTALAAEEQVNRLGARVYRGMAQSMYGANTPAGSPSVVGYSVSGAVVTVTFDRDMKNHTNPAGWVVEDNNGLATISSTAQGATAKQVAITTSATLQGYVVVSFGRDDNAFGATLLDNQAIGNPPLPIFSGDAGLGETIAPAALTAPTVSGTPQVDAPLTGTDGTYSGAPTPTVGNYQWQISADGTTGWANIAGATNPDYTPVAADETKYVRRQETATNIAGTATQVTAATAQISAATNFGPELIANNAFANGTTGVSTVETTVSVTAGVLRIVSAGANPNGDRAEMSVSGLTIGVNYQFQIRMQAITGIATGIKLFTFGDVPQTIATSTMTTYTFTVTATATSGVLRMYAGLDNSAVTGDTLDVDFVSLKEIL